MSIGQIVTNHHFLLLSLKVKKKQNNTTEIKKRGKHMPYKSCEETVQSIVQMREHIKEGTYWDCEQIDNLNQYEKKAWDSLEEELNALLEKVQDVKRRVDRGIGRKTDDML